MGNWQGAGQGAAGGALAGSAFGPWGAAIGGVVGGAAGYFGGDGTDPEVEANRQRMLEYYNGLQGHQAGMSDFRDNQRNLITNLEAQAAGRGPSLAGEQLRAATDRNVRQQVGLSQTGLGNPAAAAMMAQNNSANLGAQASQDAAAARIQEQYNAQNLLGLNIHGARGQDEEMGRFNAGQLSDADRLRLYALQGMNGQSKTGPSEGESILAGGAGMYGQAQQMRMLKGMGSQGRPVPAPTYSTGPAPKPWESMNKNGNRY